MSQVSKHSAQIFTKSFGFRLNNSGDRIGIIASTLCAINCAVSPILLLVLPAFGKIWSNPASHWVMAVFVIPIAAVMMSKGYGQHRQKWIIATGSVGILLLISGAVAPHWDNTLQSEAATGDSCCPSILSEQTGKWHLHFSMASILTTIGGFVLIIAHFCNFCRCSSCHQREKEAIA